MDMQPILKKLNIGYRWYSTNNVVPRFPFGHGLSYTTFGYSGLTVSGRTISATISNTGKVAGSEVPQLYIGFPASSGEPAIQMRGFTKVGLAAGEQKSVSWTLTNQDLSIWDATAHRWALQSGTFNIMVGASTQDIKLKGTLTV